MSPLVSVLMTAYNREKYIAEAIESVLAQTFGDFELIIVDDGSKDRTVEIARRYSSDARVRVHVNDRNLGDYPNRNRAAEFAKGHYLKYLDADDIAYAHCLEIMTRQMEHFPGAGLGLQSEVVYRWPQPLPILLSPEQAYGEHFLRQGILHQGPTGAIIPAEVFRELGGFRTERHTGDTELWLRVTRRFPLVVCGKGLTWWRRHEQQETAYEIANSAVIVTRYLNAVQTIEAEDCPLKPSERRRALRRLRRKHLECFAVAARHGKLRLAWLLLKNLRGTKSRDPAS